MKNAVFVLISISLIAAAQPESSPTSPLWAIELPENISIQVITPDGNKRTVTSNVYLPEGKYKLNCWYYDKKDAQGQSWQLHGYPTKEVTFDVGPKPVSLKVVPEPVTAELDPKWWNGFSFSMTLKGPAQERIYVYCNGKQAPAPKVEIVNQDKSFNITLAGKYG